MADATPPIDARRTVVRAIHPVHGVPYYYDASTGASSWTEPTGVDVVIVDSSISAGAQRENKELDAHDITVAQSGSNDHQGTSYPAEAALRNAQDAQPDAHGDINVNGAEPAVNSPISNSAPAPALITAPAGDGPGALPQSNSNINGSSNNKPATAAAAQGTIDAHVRALTTDAASDSHSNHRSFADHQRASHAQPIQHDQRQPHLSHYPIQHHTSHHHEPWSWLPNTSPSAASRNSANGAQGAQMLDPAAARARYGWSETHGRAAFIDNLHLDHADVEAVTPLQGVAAAIAAGPVAFSTVKRALSHLVLQGKQQEIDDLVQATASSSQASGKAAAGSGASSSSSSSVPTSALSSPSRHHHSSASERGPAVSPLAHLLEPLRPEDLMVLLPHLSSDLQHHAKEHGNRQVLHPHHHGSTHHHQHQHQHHQHGGNIHSHSSASSSQSSPNRHDKTASGAGAHATGRRRSISAVAADGHLHVHPDQAPQQAAAADASTLSSAAAAESVLLVKPRSLSRAAIPVRSIVMPSTPNNGSSGSGSTSGVTATAAAASGASQAHASTSSSLFAPGPHGTRAQSPSRHHHHLIRSPSGGNAVQGHGGSEPIATHAAAGMGADSSSGSRRNDRSPSRSSGAHVKLDLAALQRTRPVVPVRSLAPLQSPPSISVAAAASSSSSSPSVAQLELQPHDDHGSLAPAHSGRALSPSANATVNAADIAAGLLSDTSYRGGSGSGSGEDRRQDHGGDDVDELGAATARTVILPGDVAGDAQLQAMDGAVTATSEVQLPTAAGLAFQPHANDAIATMMPALSSAATSASLAALENMHLRLSSSQDAGDNDAPFSTLLPLLYELPRQSAPVHSTSSTSPSQLQHRGMNEQQRTSGDANHHDRGGDHESQQQHQHHQVHRQLLDPLSALSALIDDEAAKVKRDEKLTTTSPAGGSSTGPGPVHGRFPMPMEERLLHQDANYSPAALESAGQQQQQQSYHQARAGTQDLAFDQPQAARSSNFRLTPPKPQSLQPTSAVDRVPLSLAHDGAGTSDGRGTSETHAPHGNEEGDTRQHISTDASSSRDNYGDAAKAQFHASIHSLDSQLGDAAFLLYGDVNTTPHDSARASTHTATSVSAASPAATTTESMAVAASALPASAAAAYIRNVNDAEAGSASAPGAANGTTPSSEDAIEADPYLRILTALAAGGSNASGSGNPDIQQIFGGHWTGISALNHRNLQSNGHTHSHSHGAGQATDPAVAVQAVKRVNGGSASGSARVSPRQSKSPRIALKEPTMTQLMMRLAMGVA